MFPSLHLLAVSFFPPFWFRVLNSNDQVEDADVPVTVRLRMIPEQGGG